MTHIGPPNGTEVEIFRLLKIQDGGRPPSWKIEKSPYLYRGFSDFDKIWPADAVGPSWASQPLKIWNFQNPRWRRPPSWNSKIGHISGTVQRIFAKFVIWCTVCLRTGPEVKISNFWKFKMADSCHFENWKSAIEQYILMRRPVRVKSAIHLSLIHIWRCRRSTLCRSRWSPYH